ncbi:hypothetical protein ACE2AJ_16730 [Aquihabitans daechungensis]|uniref:hypothetical protein n=1 Tax=Aquihabitans daechungensis TaxID=1052257 RepID=UPI003B9FACDB
MKKVVPAALLVLASFGLFTTPSLADDGAAESRTAPPDRAAVVEAVLASDDAPALQDGDYIAVGCRGNGYAMLNINGVWTGHVLNLGCTHVWTVYIYGI